MFKNFLTADITTVFQKFKRHLIFVDDRASLSVLPIYFYFSIIATLFSPTIPVSQTGRSTAHQDRRVCAVTIATRTTTITLSISTPAMVQSRTLYSSLLSPNLTDMVGF